jgi:hypothetical protein
MDDMVFQSYDEWWHRRDQAPISSGSRFGVATYDMFDFFNSVARLEPPLGVIV